MSAPLPSPPQRSVVIPESEVSSTHTTGATAVGAEGSAFNKLPEGSGQGTHVLPNKGRVSSVTKSLDDASPRQLPKVAGRPLQRETSFSDVRVPTPGPSAKRLNSGDWLEHNASVLDSNIASRNSTPVPDSRPSSPARNANLQTHSRKAAPESILRQMPNDLNRRRNHKSFDRRILIVSNRLPISVSIDEDTGEITYQKSAGGLVTAFAGADFDYIWVGWPGVEIPPDRQKEVSNALSGHNYVPVFLDGETAEGYYNGFSNSVLWPLLHYKGLSMEGLERQWEYYMQANQEFAGIVMEHYRDGDLVWIHDYHLMLLPSILRDEVASMKVGWFLHTPFPSSESYRALPQRSALLKSVLSADLIGFHIFDYARHFFSSCTRILGLETSANGVDDHGRFVTVDAFPVGIDPERFHAVIDSDGFKDHLAGLKTRFQGRRVFVGVDRLDYIKGVPHKLLAFERLLEQHPEYLGKVCMIQIAVPSRNDVSEYQRLRSVVHEMVGRINGRFGSLDFVPIQYLDKTIPFDELCALFTLADSCIISSVRDGMNLVSYEYILCQRENHGVLILSEFAGAAQSLGAGSICVNPWDLESLTEAMDEALCMSMKERKERHEYGYQYVTTNTAANWVSSFVSELNRVSTSQAATIPLRLKYSKASSAYQASNNRLIILGLYGALSPFSRFKRAHISSSLMKSLHLLCADPKNTVAIHASTDKDTLERLFGDLPIWLGAENGFFIRPKDREWEVHSEEVDLSWKQAALSAMSYFTERTPKSFIEEYETSVVWHYRDVNLEHAAIQARDLHSHLVGTPMAAAFEVINGDLCVEVRVPFNRASFIERLVNDIEERRGESTPIDFALVMADLSSKDEDLFAYFEPEEYYRQVRPFVQPDAGSTESSNQSQQAAVAEASRSSGAHSPHGFNIGNTTQHEAPCKNFDHLFTTTVRKKVSQAKYYVSNEMEVKTLLAQLVNPGQPGQLAGRMAAQSSAVLPKDLPGKDTNIVMTHGNVVLGVHPPPQPPPTSEMMDSTNASNLRQGSGEQEGRVKFGSNSNLVALIEPSAGVAMKKTGPGSGTSGDPGPPVFAPKESPGAGISPTAKKPKISHVPQQNG